MNNKIETTVKRVQESPSSVFTKEDVLNLLKAMEAPEEAKEKELKEVVPTTILKEVKEHVLAGLKQRALQKFREEIEDSIDSELVDLDSAEFSIGYDKRIEVDSIDVNKEDIIEILERVLDDLEIDEEDEG